MAAVESIVGANDLWGKIELQLASTDAAKTFELRGDSSFVVGRAQGCDIHVNLPHVSAAPLSAQRRPKSRHKTHAI